MALDSWVEKTDEANIMAGEVCQGPFKGHLPKGENKVWDTVRGENGRGRINQLDQGLIIVITQLIISY